MTKTWDVMVIPKAGEPYRMKFRERPKLVLHLGGEAVASVPTGWSEWPMMATRLTIPARTMRLHLTDMGLAYVETDR